MIIYNFIFITYHLILNSLLADKPIRIHHIKPFIRVRWVSIEIVSRLKHVIYPNNITLHLIESRLGILQL